MLIQTLFPFLSLVSPFSYGPFSPRHHTFFSFFFSFSVPLLWAVTPPVLCTLAVFWCCLHTHTWQVRSSATTTRTVVDTAEVHFGLRALETRHKQVFT